MARAHTLAPVLASVLLSAAVIKVAEAEDSCSSYSCALSGEPGQNGANGADGLAGAEGAPGSNGFAGAAGQSGADGSNGLPGLSGANGAVGAAGANGVNGLSGLFGAGGQNGLGGANGQAGANGAAGLQGADGLQGANGAAGFAGGAGANGFSGVDGAQGASGLAGANGNNGANGGDGAAGLAGVSGANGLDGSSGADGAMGLAGGGGLSGAFGAAGQNGAVGQAGQLGLAGLAGANGADGAAGADGSHGAAGQNGAAGASGEDGSAGASGVSGHDGVDGRDGRDGLDGVARRIPVSTAYAAPLTASMDTCMGSSMAGAQAVGVGVSVAHTWQDDNCRRLKNARQLAALGYQRAAVQLLCVDDEVRQAMFVAGTPCPADEPVMIPVVEQAAPPPEPLTGYAVLFDFDKAILKPESTPILEEMLAVVQRRTEVELDIEGHTDSTGTDAYNEGLSHRRAQAVVDWLVAHGVSADRIRAVGKGEREPVAGNSTREGRSQNRRVEISPRLD